MLDRDLVELMAGTQPDDLCLVFIKLETIAGHPVPDPRDTRRQMIHCFVTINSWGADIDLRVVSIRVTCETAVNLPFFE